MSNTLEKDLPTRHNNREAWLTEAAEILNEELFKEHGYSLPERWSVSCGFAFGSKKAIGQCWDPSTTTDNTTHMFVCPRHETAVESLDTLVHEMVHAAVGCDKKHGPEFRKCALKVGLEGKMTSASAGRELLLYLETLYNRLGKYPNSPIKAAAKTTKSTNTKPKWIRFVSPIDPDYRVLVAEAQVEAHGVPRDFSGQQMEPYDRSKHESR